MYIKNFEINDYLNVFNKLISSDKFKDVVLQFSIFKVYNQLKQDQEVVVAFRKRLEAEFFEMNENGVVIFDYDEEKKTSTPKFKEGKTDAEYVKKLTDILNEKTNIKTQLNITLKDLQPLADDGTLIPSDFKVLHRFIKEEKEEN